MAAKVVGWVIVIIIVLWVISAPATAGTDTHTWIGDLVSFFTHLAKG